MPIPTPPFTAPPTPNKVPQGQSPLDPNLWTPEDQQVPHPVGDAILGASSALAGLIGVGPDSRANRFGQMVGTAGMPFLGGLKAAENLVPVTEHLEEPVKSLVEALHAPLPEPNLEGVAMGQRVTPRIAPPATQMKLPPGFGLGENSSLRFIPRDPAVNRDRRAYTDWKNALYPLDPRKITPKGVETAGMKAMPEISAQSISSSVSGPDDLQNFLPGPQAASKPMVGLRQATPRAKATYKAPSTAVAVKDLTPERISEIQQSVGSGQNMQEIASKFGLSQDGLRKVLKEMVWR